ncbi:hypothetical protein EV426DRAFT_677625 [Tirmania nivea]|nr:hypothetical protein EV426DRAFT_677625 [Tirmania nivea]
MEGSHFNNSNSLFTHNGTSFQYDGSGPDLFRQTIDIDLIANLNETDIDMEDVKLDHTQLEPETPFQATGKDNGYNLYPTLPPWGHNNKFSYDKWGQLSVQTKFGKADLQEYLYNHPLKDTLIIWIQRHPSQANLLYQTHYGASCRYRKCRPTKGNPYAIAVGHYRIAIDELTGRHPKHKADTYIHAAFFHVSCFEDMVDLAQITRDFDVRCENRSVVNAPNGEKKPKNRMLLEERRIPHAVTKWLERAREDPNWVTSRIEDGMNYLVFTQKFGLRPHRRKCTEVPGMEKLGRDISHLGAPRPVAPNSVWGGKRVKGLTVSELAALEGRDYCGRGKIKKRSQSWLGEGGDGYSPTGCARLASPVGDEENPIVLGSSKTPSPVRFQKPGKLRDEPYKQQACIAQRQGPEYLVPTEATVPTIVKQGPAARPTQRRRSQLPENILNASALPPGTIIRTAGGEYLRNPVTGMLEPILSVIIMDPYKHAPETSGSSSAHYTVPAAQMGFSAPAPIPTQQMDSAPSAPNIQTPFIDPLLRAPAAEFSTTCFQLNERKGEEQVNDWDGSLFGDSPPQSARRATAQIEHQLPADGPEALGNFGISQHQLDDAQPRGMEHAQVPIQEDSEALGNFDISQYLLDNVQPQGMQHARAPAPGIPEAWDNFDISQYLLDNVQPQGMQHARAPAPGIPEAWDNFDISQYLLDNVQPQGMQHARAPAPGTPEAWDNFDISQYLLDNVQPQGMEHAWDNFDISQYLLDDAQPQGIEYTQVPAQTLDFEETQYDPNDIFLY